VQLLVATCNSRQVAEVYRVVTQASSAVKSTGATPGSTPGLPPVPQTIGNVAVPDPTGNSPMSLSGSRKSKVIGREG